ncbi:F-box only protein 11-like isoform X1 [Halichondria panicea]|uniref:F-box only protein 11-like isoform X1 n=2 Tax=Halichondria panicea TaxID=6063 RepID=UPI00312B4861
MRTNVDSLLQIVRGYPTKIHMVAQRVGGAQKRSEPVGKNCFKMSVCKCSTYTDLVRETEIVAQQKEKHPKCEVVMASTRAVKRTRGRSHNDLTTQVTTPRKKKRVGNTASPVLSDREEILPYFNEYLPTEVLVHIFSFLRERDLCRIGQVCQRFRQISNLESLWKNLFHRVFDMCEAYIPPTPFPQSSFTKGDESMDFSDSGETLMPWKAQFQTMHGCSHVYQEMAILPEDHPLRQEAKDTKYYATISDAIRASSKCEPTRIIIHPAVYNENIIIDRPVQLIGSDQTVRLVNSSQTVVEITSHTGQAAVCNLTIQFEAPEDSPNVRHYCLRISGASEPHIHHCSFTNSSFCGSCIYVHGEGAKPLVSHCMIARANNVGIFVDDHAQGRFEENDIHRNKLAGVWIKNYASPVFKKNEVHHGKDVGFFIFQDGQGYLEENDIHRNRIAGVEIKNDANPIIERCTIHHGSTGGVYVHDKGRGQFIDNKIYANTYAGVWITGESNPTLQNNEIHGGMQGGVYFFAGGRGVLENNNIHSNTLAGVQIRTGSDPIIRNNKIHHGLHGGIYVHDSGRGLIEGNEIHSNALAGVWITTGSQPILRHNRIHSGKQVGIYFYDNGGGVLEENDIYNHSFSGIQIRTGSNPVIKRNKIFSGKNGGVLIYNSGEGLLVENDIYGNALAGVWIKTDSNPILRRNKIYNGKEGGICIFNSGRGVLEENDIFNNTLTGILISSASQPVLKKNRIFGGKAAGIEVTNGGGGVIEENEVFDNYFDGICLATGVSPTLKANKVYDNRRTLEDAIKLGKCLYSVSGDNSYPMHDFYRCLTCESSETDAICVNCIKSCHKNHQVQFVRHDRFFCDCGAGALGRNCSLTGYKAFSSPRSNKSKQQNQDSSQPNTPAQQGNTSTP